ncbi:MAG: hypothetical protein MJZ71_05635 [Bacteroidales bacterium]|nr:hypothetical protein [Bacteroidales bacterium]
MIKIEENIQTLDGSTIRIKVEIPQGMKWWLCRLFGIGGVAYQIEVVKTNEPETRKTGLDSEKNGGSLTLWERV